MMQRLAAGKENHTREEEDFERVILGYKQVTASKSKESKKRKVRSSPASSDYSEDEENVDDVDDVDDVEFLAVDSTMPYHMFNAYKKILDEMMSAYFQKFNTYPPSHLLVYFISCDSRFLDYIQEEYSRYFGSEEIKMAKEKQLDDLTGAETLFIVENGLSGQLMGSTEVLQLARHIYKGRLLSNAYERATLFPEEGKRLFNIDQAHADFIKSALENHNKLTQGYIHKAKEWMQNTGITLQKEELSAYKNLVSLDRNTLKVAHQNELKAVADSAASWEFKAGLASNARQLEEQLGDSGDVIRLINEANSLLMSDVITTNSIASHAAWTEKLAAIQKLREDLLNERNRNESQLRDNIVKRREMREEQKKLKAAQNELQTLLKKANEESMQPNTGNSESINDRVVSLAKSIQQNKASVLDVNSKIQFAQREINRLRAAVYLPRRTDKRDSTQRKIKRQNKEQEIQSFMEEHSVGRAVAELKLDCKNRIRRFSETLDKLQKAKDAKEAEQDAKNKWEAEITSRIQDIYDSQVKFYEKVLTETQEQIKTEDQGGEEGYLFLSVKELESLTEKARAEFKSNVMDGKVTELQTNREYTWNDLYDLNDKIMLTEKEFDGEDTVQSKQLEEWKRISKAVNKLLEADKNRMDDLLSKNWKTWRSMLNNALERRKTAKGHLSEIGKRLKTRIMHVAENHTDLRDACVKLGRGISSLSKRIIDDVSVALDKDAIFYQFDNDLVKILDENGRSALEKIFANAIDQEWKQEFKDFVFDLVKYNREVSLLDKERDNAKEEKVVKLRSAIMDFKRNVAHADEIRCMSLDRYYKEVPNTTATGREKRNAVAQGRKGTNQVYVNPSKATMGFYNELDDRNPFKALVKADSVLNEVRKQVKSQYQQMAQECMRVMPDDVIRAKDKMAETGLFTDIETLHALAISRQSELLSEEYDELVRTRKETGKRNRRETLDQIANDVPTSFEQSEEERRDHLMSKTIAQIYTFATQGSGRAEHYYKIICRILKSLIETEKSEADFRQKQGGSAFLRAVPMDTQNRDEEAFEALTCNATDDLKGRNPQIPYPTFALMRTSSLEETRRYYDKLFKVVKRWSSIRPELRAGAWPEKGQIDYLLNNCLPDACNGAPVADELTGEIVFMSDWRANEQEDENLCESDEVKQPDTVIWVHIDGKVVPVDNDGRVLRNNQDSGMAPKYNLHKTLEEQRLQRVRWGIVGEMESQASVLALERFGGGERDLELRDITGALACAHKVHDEWVKGQQDMRLQLDTWLEWQSKRIYELEQELINAPITSPMVGNIAGALQNPEELSDIQLYGTDTNVLGARLQMERKKQESIQKEIDYIMNQSKEFPNPSVQPWRFRTTTAQRASSRVVSVTPMHLHQEDDADVTPSSLASYLKDWSWLDDSTGENAVRDDMAREINKWLDMCYHQFANINVPAPATNIVNDMKERVLPWLFDLYHNGFEFPQINPVTKKVNMEHLFPEAKLSFGLPYNTSASPENPSPNYRWTYSKVEWKYQNRSATSRVPLVQEESDATVVAQVEIATRIGQINIAERIGRSSHSDKKLLYQIFDLAHHMATFSKTNDTSAFLRTANASVMALIDRSFQDASIASKCVWIDIFGSNNQVYRGTLADVPRNMQLGVGESIKCAFEGKAENCVQISYIKDRNVHKVRIFDSLSDAGVLPKMGETEQNRYQTWIQSEHDCELSDDGNADMDADVDDAMEDNMEDDMDVDGSTSIPPLYPVMANLSAVSGDTKLCRVLEKGEKVIYLSKHRGEVGATVVEVGSLTPESGGLPDSYTVHILGKEDKEVESVINTTRDRLVAIPTKVEATNETSAITTSIKTVSLQDLHDDPYDPGPILAPHETTGNARR